jgi:hypothetical protein
MIRACEEAGIVFVAGGDKPLGSSALATVSLITQLDATERAPYLLISSIFSI